MGHGHAVFVARAGQPHDMLGTDVRGEDRGADHPPAQIAAGEKIVGGRIFAPADHPPGHAQQNAEIKPDRQPIDARQGGAGRCGGKQGGEAVHFPYLDARTGTDQERGSKRATIEEFSIVIRIIAKTRRSENAKTGQ